MKQFGPKKWDGTPAGIPCVTFGGEHDEATDEQLEDLVQEDGVLHIICVRRGCPTCCHAVQAEGPA